MGSDAAEFLNKMKDQVRNRQKRMSNVAESGDEHSIICECSWLRRQMRRHSWERISQLFKISSRIWKINNQEEISCLDKIRYGKNSWTQLSLINDPVIINLQSTKVYVFSDSVLCLGKVLRRPECNEAWKNRVARVRVERSYRDYDAINGGSTEFEWNIFPGFTTLQLCDKISDLLSSMGQTPESFTSRILFMSMFNDIFCDKYDNKDDENIDFNISGIPDATVKRSQSINIHDLIQRIESHPQKEAIQNDLEQHQSFNPFSDESKFAIMAAGTLNYARLSTWSRSCNARCVLSIAVQELYTAHVDIL